MTQLVAGKYKLRAVIGEGPHGVLWLARNEATQEDLAVKVLDPAFADNPSVVDRFLREENVLTAFLHAGYVRVRQLAAEPGHIALVTELVDGTDLRRKLARSGPVGVAAATQIAATCARTIAAGHRAGVVHCGIKPSNIILTGDGRIRITDCRIARLARGHAHGPHRLGDERYIAPEVRAGGTPVPATDIYLLGLVLYEMVTGPAQADGEAASAVPPDDRHALLAGVDGRLRDLVEACLAPDPTHRPAAAWLAEELRAPATRHARAAAARSTPITVTQPTTHDVLPGDPRHDGPRTGERNRPHSSGPGRSRMSVGTAGVVTGLILAAAVVTGLVIHRSDPPPATGNAPDSQPGGAPSLASAAARPQVPEGATAETGAGAVAFVRHWFDTLNHAATTGDTTSLVAASSPTCGPCAAIARALHDAYANGGSTRGGTYTVRSIHPDSFFDLGRPTLRVVFDRTPRTTLDVAGRPAHTLAGVTFGSCQIVLERHGTRWRVLEAQSSDPVG